MDVIISGQITAILPAQQGVSQRTGQPQYQQQPVQQQFPPHVNAQGQPVQQPMYGTSPFPPQQPAGVNQSAQGQQLPFPPAQ